jgi:hypothetical protein
MDMMDYDYPDDDQYDGPSDGGSSGSLLNSIFANFSSRPMLLATAAFVIGVLVGWLAIGWGVWPMEWTDGSPANLAVKYQADYMYMILDSYIQSGDMALAAQRLKWMDNQNGNVRDLLAAIAASNLDADVKTAAEYLNNYYPTSGDVSGTGGGEAAGNAEGGQSSTGNTLLILCAVVLVLAAALVGIYILKSRGRQPTGMTAAMRAQEFTRQAQQTDYEAMGKDAPIAQWMTTYLIGDDLFDDSFSIDSPNGEFLGECGVGIADTIGVGEPKRVSAFEVWLFDKNDIQTVTKVLMSGHTYNDETSHNRLAAKGEPSLAVPNSEVVLDTKTLRMVGRVMDMEYGTGHLPENSFFQRITLELAIWPK